MYAAREASFVLIMGSKASWRDFSLFWRKQLKETILKERKALVIIRILHRKKLF